MLDTSEHPWPRLGGDPSGAESDGRGWEAGRGAAGSRRDDRRPLSSGGAEGRGQRRDVRVFDFEYLILLCSLKPLKPGFLSRKGIFQKVSVAVTGCYNLHAAIRHKDLYLQ